MANNWQEMLAELRVAIKRENDIRDASFLDLTTNIGGVAIRQMTPRDLLILDGVGNPLVTGGLPSPDQLAEFLWLLSPRFKANSLLAQWIFILGIRKMDFLSSVKACQKYVEDTFQDSPASGGPPSTPYAGWCAHLVHNIATHYGWSRREIINLSLKELFQYLKRIRRHNDPQCPMHNPSDKVKGDYLRLENARASLVKTLKRRLN
jgi:hypothetical protein